jgi:hypothetical protein
MSSALLFIMYFCPAVNLPRYLNLENENPISVGFLHMWFRPSLLLKALEGAIETWSGPCMNQFRRSVHAMGTRSSER